jgi:IS30 family transposase
MNSYIEMPAEKVRELANDCLARIEKRKRRIEAEGIAEFKERHAKSWATRLFKLKAPSDAEILKQLYWDLGFELDTLYYVSAQKTANLLLLAAEHAPAVRVSADDLNLIVWGRRADA